MNISDIVRVESITVVDLSALPNVIFSQKDHALSKAQFLSIVKAMKENKLAGITFIRFMLGANLEEAKAIFGEITK